MINWSKYFDKIYCIHFVQYTDRRQLLEFELNRVGILNSGIFQYCFTDRSNIEFCDQIGKLFHGKVYNCSYISVTLGHYKCLRDSYFKGYKNILVLEDDVRFLKDLNKIEQILENRPKEYDVIMYDRAVTGSALLNQFKPVNNYFSTFTSCYSACCYQVNQRGMKRLADLCEKSCETIDTYFIDAKRHLHDLKCICSNTLLSVQSQFESAQIRQSGSNFKLTISLIYKGYKYLKVNLDDYMLRKDGSKYNFSDYIETNKIEQLILTQEEVPQKIKLSQSIKPTTINICFSIPYNNIDKLLPIIYSLQKYSQSKLNIYIILNRQQIKSQYYDIFKPLINQNVTIKLISSQTNFNNFKQIRFSLYKIFPELDKILYLDFNTLITNFGIEWLYNIDLKDSHIAATNCNGGVMLFNLKKIRQDGELDKSKLVKINPIFDNDFLFSTQEVNNILFKKYLKQKFGFQNINLLLSKFIIQHFTGKNKPWTVDVRNFRNYDYKRKSYCTYCALRHETLEKINEYYME